MRNRKIKRRRSNSPLLTALMGVLTYLALLVMLLAVFAPEQYDLRAGQVSPITITASKDVEDPVATQALIDEAVASAPVSYTLDESVQSAVLADLSGTFDAMAEIRQNAREEGGVTTLEEAQALLPDMEITEEEAGVILSLDEQTFASLRGLTLAIADELLASRIAEGGEGEARIKLERELENSGSFPEGAVALAGRVAGVCLRANMLIDQETTELNRQKAIDAVEPVVYLKGRNIVRSGEIITKAQIAMLESLGMLKNNRSIDVLMYVGVALLALLVLLMLAIYMITYEQEILSDAHRTGLLCVILIVTCGVCMVSQNINQFLVPVALGVMLTTLLLKSRLALIVNLALGALSGLMNSGVSGSFATSLIIVMMTSIVSGPLCIALIRNKTQRVVVLLAGLMVFVSNSLTTLAVGLITEANTTNVLYWALWSGGGGLLSGVLCIGLQPLLEWVFNLVTPAKLMELSNPNHPLIRRMILEASGTYHHSIIVANLAEAAADAIGANSLLARVGAYYHDVGKLKRPMYFKENQIGDNPHDRTDPMVSAAILTAHPSDGVALAEKYRMPQPILEIIQQHHGDTPVIYFYDRCVKQNGAENVDIDDFRYPGPRPQTREAAVVMLADTIEAAARTAPDRSSEALEALIRKLIRGKIDDGQLNESPMTMVDIEKATKAFVMVLSGVFHQRVEYPEMKIPPKKERRTVPLPDGETARAAEDQKNA